MMAAAGDGLAEWRRRGQEVKRHVRLSEIIKKSVKLVQAGNEWDGLCPFHHDTSLGSFKVNDGKGIYQCFSCGASGDVFRWLKERADLKFSEAVKELEADYGLSQIRWSDPEVRAEWEAEDARREAEAQRDRLGRARRAAALWMGSAPIAGDRDDGLPQWTPALAYLAGRGIDFRPLGKVPGALRWRPDIGHQEYKGRPDNRFTAMIACVRLLDGTICAAHRTYLDVSEWDFATRSGPVGKLKALKDPKLAKMSLGPVYGGHIPLWKGASDKPLRDIPEGTDVYLSEGKEDGLSVAVAAPDRRVIAAVSGSNMPNVELPPQMGKLVIIGQRHKQTGECDEAFEKVVRAHQERGRTVSIMWPPEGYKDFNDVLTGTRIDSMGGTGCDRNAR